MSELELLEQELSDARAAGNARLDARFCAAISSMDVERVMECFLDTSDLVVVVHGNVLRGPAAVRQFLTGLFSKTTAVHLTINEVTHWNVGEMGFALGTATYEFEGLNGTKSTLTECWTDARQRVAGRLVYILDHMTQVA